MVRSFAYGYKEAYGGVSLLVWVLSLGLFGNGCGSMVLAFLTLYLMEKLEFTILEAGAIFSIYGLGSILGSYLGGRLIRPVGAVRLSILGCAISVPLFAIVPLFETFTGVGIAMFVLSLFVESVRPANNVAVSQFTKPELRTRAFGLQRMAVNLGCSVGPAVGGVLAEINYDLLFYVDGVTTGLGALLLFWFFGFRKYAKSNESARLQKLAEQDDGEGSPFLDKKFLLFLFTMLMVSIVFFQIHATYPKYMKEHFSLSKPQIGILFSINTIIIVIFEMLLVNWVRRFSLLRTIGWGCLLSCVGFGIMPASQAVWFAVASMLVITLGEMFMFPLATGFVAERSIGRNQGMYMSWYAMTYSLAAVIAPLVGTSIYNFDPHLLWYLSIGVGVFALIGFYWLADNVSMKIKARSRSVP